MDLFDCFQRTGDIASKDGDSGIIARVSTCLAPDEIPNARSRASFTTHSISLSDMPGIRIGVIVSVVSGILLSL
jgi:hypothetical protein